MKVLKIDELLYVVYADLLVEVVVGEEVVAPQWTSLYRLMGKSFTHCGVVALLPC
jgi:hypothetical protein|tara:strand:+ start:5491 stop:5655 length:165 start_codon:yes stop_codon:yes gene_type:complete